MSVGFNSQISTYSNNNVSKLSPSVNFRGQSYNAQSCDTLELSYKKDKKSNAFSWLLTGLLAWGIGTLAFFKYKKRPPQIKQLAEHIDFKDFKTSEEAVKFAKDNFGVKLEVGDDLKLVQFINNRLVAYNNTMRGSVVLPKKIVAQSDMKTIDGANALMGWSNWGEMKINRELAINSLNSKDKNEFLYMIKAFNHELGHANHQAVCKDYEKMGTLKEMKAMFIKDRHYYDEFMKDIKRNKEVKNYCTDYALTSPAEFVADVFADKIMGKEIPPEVEKLYKKYGGREVPKG